MTTQVSVGDRVRVYVSEQRSWRVCEVDTVDDGEIECTEIESGAEQVVCAEDVQHPLDVWLRMPWADKLREASKYVPCQRRSEACLVSRRV